MLKLRTALVAQYWNPMESDVWGLGRPVTGEDVWNALCALDLQEHPATGSPEENTIEWHAGRIAYLVMNPWFDEIDLDIGVPNLGLPLANTILDGNHRMAAALYRGDEFINANVDGCYRLCWQMFGVSYEDNQDESLALFRQLQYESSQSDTVEIDVE